MAQTWVIPTGTTVLSTAIKTNVADALEALRTLHSGASAPSSTVAYMLWADTGNSQIKQRDSGDSAWTVIGRVGKDHGMQTTLCCERTSLAATTTTFVLSPHEPGRINRIVLHSDTTSSSSSGNEWQFGLQNLTQAQAMFSGTVGTFTSLGGVGGGEITADTAYELLTDQNRDVAKDDVCELTVTKVGTVTTLVRLAVFVEYTLSETS